MKNHLTIGITLAVTAFAGTVFAASHGGDPGVKARKAQMQLYAFNLATLGGMAKGEIEYDADAAQAAATNLATLSTLSQRGYWTPGTSTDELGSETRALPALWQEGSNAGEIGGQLAEAAAALAEVAGNGQEALGPALGPVGAACGTCHKAYRQP